MNTFHPWIPTLEQVVERMKLEILCYVAAGVIPAHAKSFGELHDYIDANCLGGFCHDDFADALIEHFGGRDKGTEAMPDGMMDFLNSAQNTINTWLADAGLLRAMNASLIQRLIVLLDQAPGFVVPGADGSGAHLAAMVENLGNLNHLRISPDELEGATPAQIQQFSAPLPLAAFAEQLHLALLELEDARAKFRNAGHYFSGSAFEVALGNLVFTLCTENGIDLEDDNGYCNRATEPEICKYNLGRIRDYLDNPAAGTTPKSRG